MLIVVDRFDSKKAKLPGKNFYYVGLFDTETEKITYQHREIVAGRVMRGGLKVEGVTLTQDGTLRFKIQELTTIKHNEGKNLLVLTKPYTIDLNLISHGNFRFIYKSEKFYHTITRSVKYVRKDVVHEHYPDIIPNTNKEPNREHVYKHYSIQTSAILGSVEEYIRENIMLCEKYNIISLSGFPRYRNEILDLSSMLIPKVVNYTRYLSEVVTTRIVMCPINLATLFSLRFLLVNHKDLRVVDFSNSYNDLTVVYDNSLFKLTTNPPFEKVVFVFPNAPKFVDIMQRENNLKFCGYCNETTKENMIQNLLSKSLLLDKKQGMFLILES